MEDIDIKSTLMLTNDKEDYEHVRINIINGADEVIAKYKKAFSKPLNVPYNVSVRFYDNYNLLNEDLHSTKLSDNWFNMFFFNLDDNTNIEDLVEAMKLIQNRLEREKYCLIASSEESHDVLCTEYKKITGKEWQVVDIKYFGNDFTSLTQRIRGMIFSHSKLFLCRWNESISKLEALTNRKMIS